LLCCSIITCAVLILRVYPHPVYATVVGKVESITEGNDRVIVELLVLDVKFDSEINQHRASVILFDTIGIALETEAWKALERHIWEGSIVECDVFKQSNEPYWKIERLRTLEEVVLFLGDILRDLDEFTQKTK